MRFRVGCKKIPDLSRSVEGVSSGPIGREGKSHAQGEGPTGKEGGTRWRADVPGVARERTVCEGEGHQGWDRIEGVG